MQERPIQRLGAALQYHLGELSTRQGGHVTRREDLVLVVPAPPIN